MSIEEYEGDSFEEIREKLQVKGSYYFFSKKTLSDGKEKVSKAVTDTIEDASAEAKKGVPSNAKIVKETILIKPYTKTIPVQAFDELTARNKVKNEIDSTARIEDCKMTTEGRKGFLGIGKTPNIYSVTIFQPAVVEITFQRKVKIQVEVSEKVPPEGYCQACGKKSNFVILEGRGYCFCSSSHESVYFKSKVASLVGGRITVIGASATDRMLSKMYCWYCGKTMPIDEYECPYCERIQEIMKISSLK